MDLTKYLGQETAEETSSPKLSKEEYAAMKKQEREEVWGMIDGKAKEVFRDGESLKDFLDFMARCKPQRTDNLFLLYAQNPEIQQVKTFDKWKEENRVVKSGSKGYYFIVGQEYEKDSTNFQQSGRELLQPDEVRMLDNQYALLFIRGERPILDHKYDLTKHPNVRYTEDGGAEPFNYAKAPLAHDEFIFDETRYEDYELLSDEDIIGELF